MWTFARNQFDLVVTKCHLPTPWPKESDFNRVISQVNGLFIFIKTLVLSLERCENPKESLKAALQDSARTGLKNLYELYSSILTAQIPHNNAEFQRVIGVLLTTAPNHALCDETVTTLAGVELYLVKSWVDALSSLLYQDEAANRGIRIRHLLICDFFVSDYCEYQVNIRETHVQVGIACLETMLCNSVSTFASSKIPGSPMQISKIFHPK